MSSPVSTADSYPKAALPSALPSEQTGLAPSEIERPGDLAPEPTSRGLQLARLTLTGFKSFADKTVFTFDDQITGIVGPNGCGKSNVVDAIKWVLGERSSKSLRGKEMIDVIFAGSAARKPAGMASVMLTFDNPVIDSLDVETLTREVDEATGASEPQPETEPPEEDAPAHDSHLSDAEAEHAAEEGESEAASIIAMRGRIKRPLPIDTDTVEVERRLYRAGKSRYLINGRVARLRDIRDLFLDTGIGADAYSIIEQGKVDRMLLASPMERRSIFEEAAGIAKYRQRRVEAERKLDKTEQNLAVTREQLDGTERRLRMVKGQASKARRFRELDDEFQALRLALTFDQYDDIRQRLDGLTSRLAGLETTRREAEETLREAEDQRLELESDRHAAAETLRSIEDRIQSARHAADAARQRGDFTRRSIADAADTVEAETGRLEQAEAKRSELGQLAERQRERCASLEATVRELETTLERANQERADTGRSAAELRRSIDELRAACASMEREHAGMQARSQSDERRIESLHEQITEIESRIERLAADRASIEARLVDLGAQREAAESERNTLRERGEAIRTRLDQLGADRSERAGLVGDLDERRVRLDARRSALEEMVRSHEGLGDAARTVLERSDAGEGFGGVIAPLADLISVQHEDAEAVESALGDALGALVVRTIADMPGPGEVASLPGRVTFLLLEGMGPRSEPDANATLRAMEPTLNGRLRSARSLVATGEDHPAIHRPLAQLLDRLLDSTVLVEDLDTALLLAAGPMRTSAMRFVTKSGAVLEPDGRVTAGPRASSESAGMLARRAELRQIDGRLTALNAELGEARVALNAVDSEASDVERERAAVAAKLSDADRSCVRIGHELDKSESELARAERDTEGADGDAARLRARRDEIRQERSVLLGKASSLERLLAEKRGELETAGVGLARIEQEHADASERAAGARADASAAHERTRAARREIGTLEASADDAARAADQARDQIERSRATLKAHQAALEEADQAARAAERESEESETLAEAQHSAVREAEVRLASAGQTVGGARQRFEHVQRDWHALETSRRELEVKREHAEDRALEELELNVAGDYFEYRGLMADGVVERINVTECSARANVLRDEI
ncbi:MAG: AAA family ATPase, partial [Planctomycetota bacterium]